MAKHGEVYINGSSQDSKETKKSLKPEQKEEIKKLDGLVKASNQIIYELSSAFPFQLFPDKLTIDARKITIVRRKLFFKRVVPITYDQLVSVKVNRGFLFASIEFEVQRFTDPPSALTHLKPDEASQAKQYILALMQVTQAGIDLSKLDIEQMQERLMEIGGSNEEALKLL